MSHHPQCGKALGAWGAITGVAVAAGPLIGVAVAAGPLIGGAIVDGLAWQWVFWLNLQSEYSSPA